MTDVSGLTLHQKVIRERREEPLSVTGFRDSCDRNTDN